MLTTLIRSEPGDRDWGWFCQWVRSLVYYDSETGYIRHRPRPVEYFSWKDDPAEAALEWNASMGNVPVRLYGIATAKFVRMDGAVIRWRGVRLALGVPTTNFDMNKTLPNPRVSSDSTIVAHYGIGYLLMLKDMKARRAAAEEARFAAAVAKVEAKIGRALFPDEMKKSRAAVKLKPAPVEEAATPIDEMDIIARARAARRARRYNNGVDGAGAA